MKRQSSKKRSEQNLQPREEDLQRLRELLRGKPDLTEYAERLCLFRMSVVGLVKEDRMNVEKLSDLIHRVGRDEIGELGRIKLPNEFEIARNLIIRMREKGDFEFVLGVRSTV